MRSRRKNRMRKSTKYTIIIISIVLLFFSLGNILSSVLDENTVEQTKEIYKYTNKFNYNYKVNLLNNKYMSEEDIQGKVMAYVTDLINNIDLNLNYEYLADLKSNLKCNYSVTGKMQAVYSRDGEEQKIWEKEEILLNDKSATVSDDNFKISENIKLDLKDKNKLLNSFEQELGMSIDAKYMVKFDIKILTQIDGQEVENVYNPTVIIDLAQKTTKITGENNTEDTKYISKKYQVFGKSNMIFTVINVIMAIIAIALLRYATKSKVAHTLKNEYKHELNRILKLCQDKIVEVSTKPNDREQEIIIVKDFGEIVKVSEELFKPILYYDEKVNEEAWFSVMSGQTSYRYILKK